MRARLLAQLSTLSEGVNPLVINEDRQNDQKNEEAGDQQQPLPVVNDVDSII